MMTASKASTVARELAKRYDSFRVSEIRSRRFTQAELLAWIAPLCDGKIVRTALAGRSAEGRPISLYTIGQGPTKVLLWSQMHGDEPTATMALADMIRFFVRQATHPVAATISEKLTLLILPMLNPDGAEQFTRRTAQLIDMNRDALALVTPEARILKEIQQRERPEFAFNLHDQDIRLAVGSTKKHTAIALLAPPYDESRTDNDVRKRAKRVAATMTNALNEFIRGHVAKWDDTFEPRAFGDNIQKWGTSTVLVESGAWPGDAEKMTLRKLNCVGLLTALNAIADGTFAEVDTSVYEELPFNATLMCDIVIRNASYRASDVIAPVRVDVGINIDETTGADGKTATLGKIVELGDLSVFVGFREENAEGRVLNAKKVLIDAAFPITELEDIVGN
jgi:hypothetical protein